MIKNKVYKTIFLSFLGIISLYTSVLMFLVLKNELDYRNLVTETNDKIYLNLVAKKIDQQVAFASNSFQVLEKEADVRQFAQSKASDYLLFGAVYDAIKENYETMNNPDYAIAIVNQGSDQTVSTDGYFSNQGFLSFIGLSSYFDQHHLSLATINYPALLELDTNKLVLIDKSQTENDSLMIAYWNKKELIGSTQSNRGVYLATVEELGKQAKDTRSQTPSKKIMAVSSDTLANILYLYDEQPRQFLPIETLKSFLLPFIALVGFGFLIVVYLSRKAYSPYLKIIEGIKDERPATHYALEKPSSSTELTFEPRILDDLAETVLKNLLFQNYETEELWIIADYFQLTSLNTSGITSIVSLIGMTPEEAQLTAYELIQVRKKLIQLHFKDSTPKIVALSPEEFILIYPSQNPHTIQTPLDELKHYIETTLSLRCQYILSKPFQSISDLHQVFFEIYNSAVPQPTSYLATDDMPIHLDTLLSYSTTEENKIIAALKEGQTDTLKTVLNQLVKQHTARANDASTNTFFISLFVTIKRVLLSHHLPFESFYSDHKVLFEAVTQAKESSEMTTQVTALFTKVSEILKQQQQSTNLVEEILRYINNHYKQDISLGEISEKFHVSESYISRIIKERIGITFKNYLNNLKIEEAKKLLVASSCQINQVAETLGFQNANSFIRVFKKNEGITPGHYQKNYQENQLH